MASCSCTLPNFCEVGFSGHRADEASATCLSYLLHSLELDPIRHDPRFMQYLEQLGLTETHTRDETWRAAHPPKRHAVVK